MPSRGDEAEPAAAHVLVEELFGSGAVVYFAVACVVSYVFSSHRGIYHAQRVAVGKGSEDPGDSVSLSDLARDRRHWLPAAGRRDAS